MHLPASSSEGGGGPRPGRGGRGPSPAVGGGRWAVGGALPRGGSLSGPPRRLDYPGYTAVPRLSRAIL